MTAACNGMALHGGLLPYSATFLTFMDYARNAVRLAALMGVQNIFVYSHDSLAVGEDGPTHQPVEQLATLRMTPGLETWRPCDTVETAIAWREALARAEGPSALILSRQGLPVQNRDNAQVAAVAQGAYALEDDEAPELVLVATGSEVALAQAAAAMLRPRAGACAWSPCPAWSASWPPGLRPRLPFSPRKYPGSLSRRPIRRPGGASPGPRVRSWASISSAPLGLETRCWRPMASTRRT